MSLISRIALIFRAKGSATLDSVEDPIEMMEYGYQQQQALLQKVKLGLVDVATSKQQLERQARELRARAPQMDDQAKRAIAAGREDLARIALERKHTAMNELGDLERQLAEVADEQRKLAGAETQLASRIEAFRTHKNVATARYTAAQAQVRVNEALTGVGGELAELSMALGRAEEKTDRMISRASAIDALIASGALETPLGGDRVEVELRKISVAKKVEDELAALKSQVGAAGGAQ